MSNLGLVVDTQSETKKAIVTIMHEEGDNVAIGSGFFIASPPGDNLYRYILTCAHCIIDYTNASSIRYASDLNVSSSLSVYVFYPENELVTGTNVQVVGFDFLLDVALLRIPKKPNVVYSESSPNVLTLGDNKNSSLCYTGAYVYAPCYDINTDCIELLMGTVVNPLTQFGQSTVPDSILCDLPIQPGNSGCPVLVNGNVVVGMVSFLFVKNTSSPKFVSVTGARLIQYLVSYFYRQMSIIPFPILYPIQCLGFDYTFTNPMLNFSYFPSTNGAVVRRLHYHHVLANEQTHLELDDIVTHINGLPVRNNIFEVLYKLGDGVSHMDLLDIQNNVLQISDKNDIVGFVNDVNEYLRVTGTVTLNKSVASGVLTVTSSQQQWTVNVNGTAIAGVMEPALGDNGKVKVVHGSILLSLSVVNPPDLLFRKLKIVGILEVTNSVIVPSSLLVTTFKSDYLQGTVLVTGNITSNLSVLPNLDNFQASVSFIHPQLNVVTNTMEGIPETANIFAVDFHTNMLDYVPTLRQFLNVAQYVSFLSRVKSALKTVVNTVISVLNPLASCTITNSNTKLITSTLPPLSTAFDLNLAKLLLKCSSAAYDNSFGWQTEIFNAYSTSTYGSTSTTTCLVASDSTSIIVSFRGTFSVLSALTDTVVVPVNGIHAGYNYWVSALKDCVIDRLKALQAQQPRRVYVTGHSLGGAMAEIFSLLYYTETGGKAPDAVYTFSAPPCFDSSTAASYNSKIGNTWRVYAQEDPVPFVSYNLYVHTNACAEVTSNGSILNSPTSMIRVDPTKHLISTLKSYLSM